ncbi:ferrochelatase [Burkholderiaceae bacterium DAT-1]|nr:ferrochelatase [Burkholderiaceae bacterium DAT-1]
MSFLQEPAFQHGRSPRTGILLINLGTPDAPDAKALRPYLKQFLSDQRVVEIPRLLWWPILNLIILNTRPARSAEKYRSIWTPEGSPLAVYTRRSATLLQGRMGESLSPTIAVRYAMRYGNPSVSDTLMAMKADGVERVLAVPLYPQYAASSTGSAMDAVATAIQSMRNPPEIRLIKHFHDHPAYIRLMASRIEEHWQQHGRGDHLLMSFHGVPRFSLDKGDPYHCECHKSARLIAEALRLNKDEYTVCFQSRFGKAEWLKPYTSEVLMRLGQAGTRALDVVCPGFVADCLETLEEIAIEGKETFQHAGGGDYRYIAAPNDGHDWIAALSDIVTPHLGGWVLDADKSELSRQQSLARALGAKQ